MSWIDNQPVDFFTNAFIHSEVPMVVCASSGKILWVNRAFEDFIGYNSWELTVGQSGTGITWEKLSLNDENLEADRAMIKQCIDGDLKSYSIKKQYIPKNDKPVWVDMHVVRYPLDGELKYFMITVMPLKNGTAAAFNTAISAIKEFTDKMNAYTAKIPQMEEKIISGVENKIKTQTEIQNIFLNVAKLVEKYPKVSIAVVMTILVMILGNQLVEAIKNMKAIIGG
jgi:PAS domain S-box-containing protein